MTQTTSWASLTIGAFLGAVGAQFGFVVAFVFNALSFVISCAVRVAAPARGRVSGRTGQPRASSERPGVAQYRDGASRYMRATPLVSGIAMLSVGWASGGGAAQILFSLFGEKVFNAGPMGIGMIWGFAGIGLLIGGVDRVPAGQGLTFVQYKRTIAIVYVIHGGAYVLFSQMPTIALACVFIADFAGGDCGELGAELLAAAASCGGSVSRAGVRYAGIADVVDDDDFDDGDGGGYDRYSPRVIGAWAGAISSMTAIFWTWANLTGRLPEPLRVVGAGDRGR